MRKLALLLLPLLPLTSCRPSYAVTAPTEPCVVPPWPAVPVITSVACDPYVCISPQSAVDLAHYLHDAMEVELALASCSLVVRK